MTQLSRRSLLKFSAAAVAAAAAGPAAALAPAQTAAAPLAQTWLVGTPGEADWRAVKANSLAEAIRERRGHDDDCGAWCEAVEDGAAPPEDCECDFCAGLGCYKGEHVAGLDGKRVEDITPGDWIESGYGHFCSRCDCEAYAEIGAHAVGGEAVCKDCMTLADWDIVDPAHAAELRAEMAEDA